MNCPSNISFSTAQYSTKHFPGNNDNEEFLLSESPGFSIRLHDMLIYDPASIEDLNIRICVSAQLVKYEAAKKLQCLKLITEMPNTYILSLNFTDENHEIYSLSGRNTSEARKLARKKLLASLSCANYNSSIEKARQNTLYAFSSFIATNLFAPNIIRSQTNLPLINTWLTKLLG